MACICFLFAACQNPQQPKTENVIETKPVIKHSAIALDTSKVVNQTSVSGSVGADSGTKKDTTKKSVKPNAIIHKAPEQEKIDSIKKAKQKLKK
jgi:hypothetical protein